MHETGTVRCIEVNKHFWSLRP